MTMSKHYTNLLMAVGLALAFTGTARADDGGGGGGDNSMSQWTGESYAAFHRGEVGDFYTDPSEMAADQPTDKSKDESKKTDDNSTKLAGSSARQPRSPFRDDTAA
jgi:hypothetical protein